MKHHLAHEKKEIAELKKKKLRCQDQHHVGRLACLIEEKEAALILVNAAISANKKLGGAL